MAAVPKSNAIGNEVDNHFVAGRLFAGLCKRVFAKGIPEVRRCAFDKGHGGDLQANGV